MGEGERVAACDISVNDLFWRCRPSIPKRVAKRTTDAGVVGVNAGLCCLCRKGSPSDLPSMYIPPCYGSTNLVVSGLALGMSEPHS
jgi:hypothetical protein